MPSRDEILWDRVAKIAKRTGKKYAVLNRGAWGERIIRPIRNENNTFAFTGTLINPDTLNPKGEEVVIGFYHPLFNGYAPKGTYVEVVDSQVSGLDIRYIARGRGYQAVAAIASCIDDPPPEYNPCEETSPCESFAWGLTPISTPLGTEDSTLIYDYDTMTHDMGPNEIPAYLSLPGYDGETTRPTFARPLLLSWSPNVSAFQPTFQLCGQAGVTCGDDTDGLPPFDCCQLVRIWEEQYGDQWCQIVKAILIETGLGAFGFPECNWLKIMVREGQFC